MTFASHANVVARKRSKRVEKTAQKPKTTYLEGIRLLRGQLAQRESTRLTRGGSQVQSLHCPIPFTQPNRFFEASFPCFDLKRPSVDGGEL